MITVCVSAHTNESTTTLCPAEVGYKLNNFLGKVGLSTNKGCKFPDPHPSTTQAGTQVQHCKHSFPLLEPQYKMNFGLLDVFPIP